MSPISEPLVDDIAAALVDPLPCPACGRTLLTSSCRCYVKAEEKMRARAKHVAAVLGEKGWVHEPPPPEPDLDEVARFLAAASKHPRFEEDGWRNLLVADGDVEMAYRHAMEGVNASLDREHASALSQARVILSAAARRASGVTGL